MSQTLTNSVDHLVSRLDFLFMKTKGLKRNYDLSLSSDLRLTHYLHLRGAIF